MTRLRVGLSVTVLIGAMYAACGLFNSLTDFGIGLVVASLGVIGYGLVDFIEAHEDEQTARGRDAVWARRDGEVTEW
jgi:hypothetical protein